MERHHNGLAVKVSQLQAILSRRCVAIGNVQQQFLRASGVDGAGVGGLRVVGGHWGVVLDVGEEGVVDDVEGVKGEGGFNQVGGEKGAVSISPISPLKNKKKQVKIQQKNVEKQKQTFHQMAAGVGGGDTLNKSYR